MKKCKIMVLVTIMIFGTYGCGQKNTTNQVETNETEVSQDNMETEPTTQDVIKVDMGEVKSVVYSGYKDIFLGYAQKSNFLFYSSGEIIKKFDEDVFIDTYDEYENVYLYDGICRCLINDKYRIIDYKGNDITSNYVSNADRLCGLTIMDAKPVVIAVVNNNTVTTSDSSLILYNKDKSIKFSINLSELSEKEKNIDYNYFQKMEVKNIGDDMLLLSYSSEKYILNTQNSNIFMICDTMYAENTEKWSKYHGGYISYRNLNETGVVDKNGKIVLGSKAEHPLDCAYSQGVYFNFTDKKFYNKSGEVVIDLSQYNVEVPDTKNATVEELLNKYVFNDDGYCDISVQNPSGVQYQGIIDINGRWVVELSEKGVHYIGKKEISATYITEQPFWGTEAYWFSINDK